ncbi:hypothetical protein PQI23_05605 [Leucobacter sp. USCH14]|uniref:hypothetical protein n=1 Tax=Leucobacter sp. USCH14 TaxID=3024838 RepID=UPI0030A772AA
MVRRSTRTPAQLVMGVTTAAALLVGLSACAPEPSDGGNSDSASSASADADAGAAGSEASSTADGEKKASGDASGDSDGGWPQQGDPQENSKSTSLPASFPSDSFAVPDGAVIDDAGERSAGEWYLVLNAKDQADADASWQAIVDASGFTESDRSETENGDVSATLTNAGVSVFALQIPQEDGSVLVSFDITATGG